MLPRLTEIEDKREKGKESDDEKGKSRNSEYQMMENNVLKKKNTFSNNKSLNGKLKQRLIKRKNDKVRQERDKLDNL